MLDTNFKSIMDIMQAFPTEQACIDYLEEMRWGGEVKSPYDPSSKVYRCKGNKFKCKNTGKYFTVRTKTLFDSSNLPLIKWFLAIWMVTCHKKGVASCQLARDINVTQKTAWFMLHRIRKCFGIENDSELDNEVEVDETFVGGKNKNRHRDKKVEKCQGRSFRDKTPVVGMIERGGKAVTRVVPNTRQNTLTPIVLGNVNTNAKLYSDEWEGYNRLKDIYNHDFVNHGKGIYVSGNVYTNTVEGFWSIIKRGIIGIYHYISRKYMQMYMDEYTFRYNTRHMTQHERFSLLLSNTNYPVSYKELVYGVPTF